MPLIVDREQVLAVYAAAAAQRRVIPCFGSENLTTTEAILGAACEFAQQHALRWLPITIAVTNQYAHRSQSANYTHTGRWDVGLRLFMADLRVLTADDSPYARVAVTVHLDHTQHDCDRELLGWDLRQFSSIMFDASTLPFEENLVATREFVRRHRSDIVIEGACDEIVDAGGDAANELTTPDRADRYLRETGVDMIVANLGTEHRASAASLQYHGELAREISHRTGAKLVLHGCSSVAPQQVRSLYEDGVCKVNIWTALERDSSPVLLANMLRNAAKVVGPRAAAELRTAGLLGPSAPVEGQAALSHCTTAYRQDIVFRAMKDLVTTYLELWWR